MECRDSRIITNLIDRLATLKNEKCYAIGSTYKVHVTSIDVDYVDVLLSRDGLTYETLVSSAAVSHYTSGSQEIYEPFTYDWAVSGSNSNTCYIKIVASDYDDIEYQTDRFSISDFTNNTQTLIEQVIIPKKTLKINSYPCMLVQWNENQSEEEGFTQEQSSLDVILIYIDGKNDDDENVESYQWRYRNVYADAKKLIMIDPTMGGECEYIKINDHAPMIFTNNNEDLEAYVLYLSIMRATNMYDPYL